LIVVIVLLLGCLLLFHQTVMSSNEALKKRVEAVLDMAVTTVSTLSEAFSSGVVVSGDDAGLMQGSVVEEMEMEKKLEEVPEELDGGSKASVEVVVAVSDDHDSEQ
jgi:cleavage and polyadenylation specificity factor subunit 3